MLTIARKSTLEIVPADEEDARTLERLIDLYCYDYSEFDEADVLDSGSYEYIDVAQYVKKKTNYPHFIKYNGKYAGFALIQKITDETGTVRLRTQSSDSLIRFITRRVGSAPRRDKCPCSKVLEESDRHVYERALSLDHS